MAQSSPGQYLGIELDTPRFCPCINGHDVTVWVTCFLQRRRFLLLRAQARLIMGNSFDEENVELDELWGTLHIPRPKPPQAGISD